MRVHGKNRENLFKRNITVAERFKYLYSERDLQSLAPSSDATPRQILAIIGQIYGIKRAASDKHLDASARQRLRQKQARPILEKLHAYLRE